MTSEVFGRPIEGEIRPTSDRQQKQADPMEFIKALDELLDHPGVIEYKWTQYTQYWNDGEPVEFMGLTDYNAGVKLEFGNPEGGEMSDGYYTSFRTWHSTYGSGDLVALGGVDTVELGGKLANMNSKVHGGSHDIWMKETFGDHATVIANKEGFKVEFYEHD